MQSRTTLFFGSAGTIVFMVLALWTWQNAAAIAGEWTRPELALWSMRCAAVSAAALAQGLLLTLVVGGIYRRDVIGDLLRLTAAVVFSLAAASAVALGVIGR